MATQPLYQSYNPPMPPIAVAAIGNHAKSASALASAAVRRVAAEIPAAVRKATLDEITIAEMATSLIGQAKCLLSAPMYAAFLAWGAAAAMFAAEYDEEGDELCTHTVDALEALSAVPAWTFQDFVLKAWLLSVEVSDSAPFGPLTIVPENTSHTTVVIAQGLGPDMSRGSPVVGGIERLARFAGNVASNARGFTFPKAIGQLIANAFIVAQTEADYRGQGTDWEHAMALYLSARALSESTSCDASEADERVNAYCELMDHVIINVPAPDVAAIGVKFDLVMERQDGFDVIEEYWNAIRADVERLSSSTSQDGEPDRHVVWLAERNQAQAVINALGETELSEEGADALSVYAAERDRQIIETPATTRDGTLAKLALVAQINVEGFEPNMDWCASALIDARRVVGIGSLAAAAEERHREMVA
jgi:hypothetical protein